MRHLGQTLAAALVMLLGSTAAPGWAADFVLRAGHDQTTDASYHQLETKFAELVAARSNGRVQINVFPGATLGSELEMAEGLRLGTIDFSAASVGNVAALIPKAGLLGAGYLVRDKAHRERLVDQNGAFYKRLAQVVDETNVGIKLLGLTTAGVRSVYNSKRPIRTPDDLRGMKVRTMTSDVQVQTWKAMGAIPTPIAFAEVYTALKSGVIDGAENAPVFYYTMKHHEAARYYSLTEHMVATGLFMMSRKTYDRLPADLREIIVRAAGEACAYEREIDERLNDENLKRLIATGVQVNEVDKEPFIQRSAPIQDKLAKDLGATDLLELIRRAAQ
jgi:tripartite ATP-independent transporter DctP family solute receptor